MTTVSQAIDKAQRREPNLSDARGLELLLDAHREILFRAQIRNSSDDVSLTQGTHEYDLPSGVLRVFSAVYVESADTGYQLTETSLDAMEVRGDAWLLSLAEEVPSRFYTSTTTSGNTSKLRIGMDAKAPATTSGGYPVLRLRTTKYTALGTGDELPPMIATDEVYVHRVCCGHALDQKRWDEAEHYRAMFEREMDALVSNLKRTAGRLNDSIQVGWAPGGRVV